MLGMNLIRYTRSRNLYNDYRQIKADPDAKSHGLDGMKEKAMSADISSMNKSKKL
jgi:hypothetical protein